MTYGQEVPFANSACEGESSCDIRAKQEVTVTNTYEIISNLEQVFNAGASYSYSKAITYGTDQKHTEDLNGSSCGYWTFIPYMMT